jgi:hypothetical protein
MPNVVPDSIAPENGAPENAPPTDYDEDAGYSAQFFTISRRGHTGAAAECGAPTMVWHVAFWPRRVYDPFSVATTGDDGRIKDAADIIREFGKARGAVVKDFNSFLEKLQARGRHPAAPKRERPFELRRPRDWEVENATPFDVFDSESMGFTLWWPDAPAAAGPDNRHMMSGRPEARPIRTDLRVRVQAEVNIDYSVVTFFIDAGKPWNEPPVYLAGSADVPDEIGRRRQKIFKHIKNIKTISEERLEAADHDGKRLIDLDRLPEPESICGTSEVKLESFDGSAGPAGSAACAKALKDAADYLYDDIWKEFCADFGFSINDIAGETDVVFANFRGLVMSTCGTEVTEHGMLVKAPERDPGETSHPGSTEFPRFEGDGNSANAVEPNAVVKAYMPFMRRFRAEGDWRDWIACGIFDWRAIYITAVGAQSEFAAFDECDFDLGRRIPSVIPAGYIPERRVTVAGDPAAAPGENAKHNVPTTAMNDRPAPFRFLVLTKFEPDRKQVGRMLDRINSIGARRLFALKDWSVIQNAGVWINHYGRQLDKAYGLWISETGALDARTWHALKACNAIFWAPIQPYFDALNSPEVARVLRSYWRNPNRACEELELLAEKNRAAAPAQWGAILAFARDNKHIDHPQYRTIDGDHNSDLAAIDRRTEHALIAITAGLDELGAGAVGGLPYRIARSHYYADTFRDAHLTLRVGRIETWWSYDQFAKRGMEPVLQFIASVGERLDKLRSRLQTLKQDILQRSIAIQIEATRDNTHRLERIQSEIKRMADETHAMNVETAVIRRQTAEIAKVAAQLSKWHHLGSLIYSGAGWIIGAIGGAAAIWAYLFKAH